MNDENEEYVLGRDVTQAAEAKARRGTVVLSIRVSTAELASIEEVCLETGKNVSQVVRDAVRNCLHTARIVQPRVTVSIARTGTTSSYGPSSTFSMGREIQSAVTNDRQLFPAWC